MLDIKVLTPNDWDVLRKIRLTALDEAPNMFLSTYRQEKEYDRSKWQSEFSRGEWYVGMVASRSHDEPVSVLGMTREPGTPIHQRFLEYLWVAPEFRRRGVAFTMIRLVLDQLRSVGVRTVFLWVLDGNDNAMRLYKRLGFVSCNKIHPLEARPGRSEELMQLHFG